MVPTGLALVFVEGNDSTRISFWVGFDRGRDIAIENPLLVSIALFCVSLLWCFLHRAVVDGFILNLE